MKIYKYKNYAAYYKAQVAANKSKLATTWARHDVINMVCDRIIAATRRPVFGLCHGTRRGEEQQWFADRLMCRVLGTEISPTAEQFPNTIQWDFHQIKDEWLGRCDFVYSNSLDHAKNPTRALAAWVSCLAPGGVLAIEWVERLGKNRVKRSTSTDPFSATAPEVCALIEKAGAEVYEAQLLNFIPERRSYLIFARRQS